MLCAAVLFLAALCFWRPSPGSAAPATQRSDGLDQPLRTANLCGAGDPSTTHFTFAATGDSFPHENIQAVGEAQGYETLFDYVCPFLQAADIAYTNFDGAMLAGSAYTGYPMFNYNPQLAAALKNAGIGLVSTANNHILDRGPEGLDATLAVLEQSRILHHGAVRSDAGGQIPPYLPITLTRDGMSVTIGFLAFTWGTNGIPDPYRQVNLLWQSNSYGAQGGLRQSVIDAIAQARRETDLVVVAAHWGHEYQFYPEAFQVEAAGQMAAAGADVILGAQAHTLQPVDIIDTGGRKTLVIYSLANFLASQGAYQAAVFSATSVVFYVGIVREADDNVRVSGYRYLPTIHVDADTRPAPIPAQGYEAVIAHVRRQMRDFNGLFQLNADPAALQGRVAICPAYTFGERPDLTIPGDFAQFYRTLGGETLRAPNEALAVLGYPLGPVAQELSGDCVTPASVLMTERQRLELHPGAAWPYRVMGTQIGAEAYWRRYGVNEVQRRLDLAGDAFADERFRAFFQTYGGLAVFGYPISPALIEADVANGQPLTTQYFERARFELVADAPPGAGLREQVRLGLLGLEYAGIAEQCELVGAAPSQSRAGVAGGATVRDQVATAVPARWPWFLLASIVSLLAAGLFWMRDERKRRSGRVRRSRAERTARYRQAQARIAARQRRAAQRDEELLRELLER
jgi:poly-gamma-glutamate synthesis protein (capsule biosynthesis protein)